MGKPDMSDMGAFTPRWGKDVDNYGGSGVKPSLFHLFFRFLRDLGNKSFFLSTLNPGLSTQ